MANRKSKRKPTALGAGYSDLRILPLPWRSQESAFLSSRVYGDGTGPEGDLPAVLGANILSLVDAAREGIDMQYVPAYLIGMAVAMVSGIGAISLLKYISKNSKFGGFAYYCWVAGALTIVLSMIF